MIMFYVLVLIFTIFMLWLGTKILDKAGFDKRWVLCLIIPVANIIMIWVFAFSHWPKLKDDIEQGLN